MLELKIGEKMLHFDLRLSNKEDPFWVKVYFCLQVGDWFFFKNNWIESMALVEVELLVPELTNILEGRPNEWSEVSCMEPDFLFTFCRSEQSPDMDYCEWMLRLYDSVGKHGNGNALRLILNLDNIQQLRDYCAWFLAERPEFSVADRADMNEKRGW